MKKLIVGIAILLGLLLLGAVILLFTTFDSPGFGRAILERLSQASALELSAEKFALKLTRGLNLEGFHASGAVGGGNHLDARIERFIFEHKLIPLLSRKLVVERVRLDRPRVEITGSPSHAEAGQSGSGAPAPQPATPSKPAASASSEPASSSAGDPGATLEVSEVTLDEGSVKVQSPSSKLAIEGLGLQLRNIAYTATAASALHGLSGQGELVTRTIDIESFRVSDLRGNFKLETGQFQIPEVSFTTKEGRFRGNLGLDFNRSPFGYTLALKGEPLDLNAVVGVQKGGGFGLGHLDLNGEGFGTDSAQLKAKGSLRLDEGTLPQHPVIVGVMKALGKGAEAAPYKATKASFQLEKNRLSLDPFKLETPSLGVEVKGWADLAGPLDLDLAVRAKRAGVVVEGVGDHVLDTLADGEGWIAIPMSVTGTIEKPVVRPDTKALLKQAGQGAKREVKKKAGEELKKLIPRKRDE